MPDRCGEREDALGDAGADALNGLASVAFDVELTFEGCVDRLDDLTQRFEELAAGTSTSCRNGLRSQTERLASGLTLAA